MSMTNEYRTEIVVPIAVIRWAQSQQMQFSVTEDPSKSTSGRTVRIRTSL